MANVYHARVCSAVPELKKSKQMINISPMKHIAKKFVMKVLLIGAN